MVLLTLNQWTNALPQPQGPIAQGIGEFAGSAFGAAAGSFAREIGGGGLGGFRNPGFGGHGLINGFGGPINGFGYPGFGAPGYGGYGGFGGRGFHRHRFGRQRGF